MLHACKRGKPLPCLMSCYVHAMLQAVGRTRCLSCDCLCLHADWNQLPCKPMHIDMCLLSPSAPEPTHCNVFGHQLIHFGLRQEPNQMGQVYDKCNHCTMLDVLVWPACGMLVCFATKLNCTKTPKCMLWQLDGTIMLITVRVGATAVGQPMQHCGQCMHGPWATYCDFLI